MNVCARVSMFACVFMKLHIACLVVCVCMCVCVFIKLLITPHSGPVISILVILCYSHWSSQGVLRDQ